MSIFIAGLLFSVICFFSFFVFVLFVHSQAIAKVLMKTPIDSRKELSANILLCGGTSLLDGLPERLLAELQISLPDLTPHFRVHAESDRKFSVWRGGSFLAGLDQFQSSWSMNWEYKESGWDSINRTNALFAPSYL